MTQGLQTPRPARAFSDQASMPLAMEEAASLSPRELAAMSGVGGTAPGRIGVMRSEGTSKGQLTFVLFRSLHRAPAGHAGAWGGHPFRARRAMHRRDDARGGVGDRGAAHRRRQARPVRRPCPADRLLGRASRISRASSGAPFLGGDHVNPAGGAAFCVAWDGKRRPWRCRRRIKTSWLRGSAGPGSCPSAAKSCRGSAIGLRRWPRRRTPPADVPQMAKAAESSSLKNRASSRCPSDGASAARAAARAPP